MNNMKNLHVRVWCQACYDSIIPVPAHMTKEEAFAYAKEHIEDIPMTSLEYLPDSDELDDADLDNEHATYFKITQEEL